MTNLKSVDNYRFMTAEPFVMNNSIYCLIGGIQLIIYTIAPDQADTGFVSFYSADYNWCVTGKVVVQLQYEHAFDPDATWKSK